MTRSRLATGRLGERLAAAHLTGLGWRIVSENWRCALGEIDLVAHDGPSLVLVEVRTRRGERFGPPEDSIGPRKRRKLAMLAQAYMQSVGWSGPVRIDVVAVVLNASDEVASLTHYRGAIGSPDA